MAQLTSGTVTLAVYKDMLSRYKAYVTKNKSLPSKIYTISGGSNYVTLAYFDVMVGNKDRYVAYYKTEPSTITITKTAKTYTSTTSTTTTTTTSTTDASFAIGYFINPDATALSGISWSGLKAKGITEVYIRILNSNYTKFASTLAAIKAAGLKPYAWTWQGFSYTSYLANQGWNICLDIENYSMASYYTEIKTMQTACKAANKTFILCTKPQDWDGAQQWATIKDYCDYIMPMLYIGDYGKTTAQLIAYMKTYNTKYPGKIMPCLETYVSDANVVAKSNSVLMAEFNGVKPYCKGIALFRYGLSNF